MLKDQAITAAVLTGACFANGEAEQVGREAGDWHGVSLEGFSVAGVIRSGHTLGLVSEPVNPARAVLIVDNRANPEQRLALQRFAKQMGGELLKDVVKVDYAALNFGGHVCGNEEVWSPPLNAMDHAMPAYALDNSFTGEGLGETWHNRMRRSGFLGTFQVPAE